MKFIYSFKQDDLDLFESKNCTMYVSGDEVVAGRVIYSSEVLELRPNLGFFIDSASLSGYFGGIFERVTATIDVNGVARFVLSSLDDSTVSMNWDIEVSTVSAPVIATFAQRDIDFFESKKCSMYIGDLKVDVGDEISVGDVLELRPNAGIKITRGYFYAWFSGILKEVNATIDGDGVAFFDMSGISGTTTSMNWEFSIASSVVAIFEQKDLDYWALTEGVGYLDDVVISVGDSWLKTQTLKIVSPEGWVYSSGKVGGYVDGIYRGSVGVIDPVNVVSFNSETPLILESWSLIATQVTPEVIGINQIFKVTSDNINEIMSNRLKWEVIDTSQNTTPIDYGNYILGLIQLPWDLDSDFLLGSQNIRLLDWDTEVSAPLLSDDSYTYDFGEIDLTDKSTTNNHTNSKIVLNLPRCESMEMEPDVVLGFVLKIEYVVSLYDGLTNVNVIRDGVVVYSKTVDLGINVPYGTSFHTAIHTAENVNVSLGIENGILNPFVEIYTGSDLKQLESIFSAPIKATEFINEQSGYFTVDDIDLSFKCSNYERDALIGLLRSGVFKNN